MSVYLLVSIVFLSLDCLLFSHHHGDGDCDDCDDRDGRDDCDDCGDCGDCDDCDDCDYTNLGFFLVFIATHLCIMVLRASQCPQVPSHPSPEALQQTTVCL